MKRSRTLAIEACKTRYPDFIKGCICGGFFIANNGDIVTKGFFTLSPPWIARVCARIGLKWHWVTTLELRDGFKKYPNIYVDVSAYDDIYKAEEAKELEEK